jgi:hypothetical protein
MDNLLPEHALLLERLQRHRRPGRAALYTDIALTDVASDLPFLAILEPALGGTHGYRFLALGSEVVRLTGRDYVGQPVEAAMHPSERAMALRMLGELKAEAKPKVLRGQWRKPEASDEVLERLFYPCLGPEGAVAHILVSIRPFPLHTPVGGRMHGGSA